MFRFVSAAILALTVSPQACLAQQAADGVAPETATVTEVFSGLSLAARASIEAKQAGRPVLSKNWMIAAANPLAVEAGAKILRDGGTAADAMVAVQVVLGLVEPQSSGLGGGAFLVWYDAASGEVTTLDGRETAPADVTPTLFQDQNGEPLKFYDAVVGGLSVGTPGTPMLLETAHKRWGNKPWASLFDDAISLARDGFAVSPRLAGLIAGDAERLVRFATSAAYFLPGGQPLQTGDILKNPDYAITLSAIAQAGAAAFYSGEIAADIVETVASAEGNPGRLSLFDLATYRVKERKPVCVDYRSHAVCGMGPPSSGALTIGQILGLIQPFDIAGLGSENPQSWRIIGDAERLAFADRGRYMADSDFVPMPVKGLVDGDYLADRAKLLSGDKALEIVEPGMPEFDHAMILSDDEAIELPSTSHISIVDTMGNALSMTTTIENGFGSRLMVRGLLLNNQLTDFSFRSHKDGAPIANRIEPGKRPRSSMAPTIVLKDGKPVLLVGSPGGSSIIGYVAQTIIGVIDWGLDVQSAVSAPHLNNRFGTFDLEEGTQAAALLPALEALGFKVKIKEMNSGLHAIAISPDGLSGAADPRREGIALGQ